MTTLSSLLKNFHSAVFDKTPDADLAFRLQHPGLASWSVADGVLTASSVAGESRSYDLSTLTIGQLVYALQVDGFDVPALAPAWADISALALVEGSGGQSVSNGDRLHAFRSLLWVLLSGYAAEVRAAKAQVPEALAQMSMTTASADWLDLWGTIYGVPRRDAESDAAFALRIRSEVFRERMNARAIEKIILEDTGWDVRIEEPWKELFRLDESRLSGGSRMYDGAHIGYHLIRPESLTNDVDWTVVLPIIARNKPAGVIIVDWRVKPTNVRGDWVRYVSREWTNSRRSWTGAAASWTDFTTVIDVSHVSYSEGTLPPWSAQTGSVSITPTVSEGGTATVSVTMTNTSGAVGVPWSITGTGITSADYGIPVFSHGVSLTSGTLLVPEGVAAFTVALPISADLTTEGGETLVVHVGALSASVAIGDASTTPAATVSSVAVSGGVAAVDEGASVAFVVTMTNATGAPVVPWSLTGIAAADHGSITFGSGVTAIGAVLTVPAGVSSFLVTVPIIADLTTEGGETMTLTAGAQFASVLVNDTSLTPVPVVVAVASSGGVTSINEGDTLVFNVTLSSNTGVSGIPLSVTGVTGADIGPLVFGSGVTASGSFLTVPAGVSGFTVSVPIVADLTSEGTETLTLTVGAHSASVSVIDTSAAAVPPLLGAVLWVDPSNLDTLTMAGANVMSVTNLATGEEMPTDPSGSPFNVIEGVPGLNFLTGSGEVKNGLVIDGGGITLTTYTLFAVTRVPFDLGSSARSIMWISNGQLTGSPSASGGPYYAESGGGSPTNSYPGLHVYNGAGYRNENSTASFSGSWSERYHQQTIVARAATHNSVMRRDGAPIPGKFLYSGAGSAGAQTFTHVHSQTVYNMDDYQMGEFFVVPRECTPEEIELAEAYLRAKWGTPAPVTITSPLDLPGIRHWYDASQPATYTVVDGKITEWQDLAPGGNNLVSLSASDSYSLSAGTAKGGKNQFVSSSGGLMQHAGIEPVIGQHSVFVVGSHNGAPAYGCIFLTTNSSNNYRLLLTSGSLTSNLSGTLHGVSLPSNWGADLENRVMYSVWDGNTPQHGITDGLTDFGALMSSGAPTLNQMFHLTFYAASALFNLRGSICEVIVCEAGLPQSQVDAVKKYLSAKWGLN